MLKFLVDENIPEEFVNELKKLGFDVISIREIKRGMKNHEIAELSKLDNRIIVTLDKRFLWSCLSAGVKPVGIILLRPIKRFDVRTLLLLHSYFFSSFAKNFCVEPSKCIIK